MAGIIRSAEKDFLQAQRKTFHVFSYVYTYKYVIICTIMYLNKTLYISLYLNKIGGRKGLLGPGS